MLSDVTLQGSPVSPALRPSSSVPTPRSVSGRYQVARRAAQVVGAATPLILDYWRDEQRFFFFGGAREVSEATHQYRARRIRSEIERLGIGFIKVGQVISTRGDLLPTSTNCVRSRTVYPL
jgi:predicted unusual protein kinase regulating ubiquinone biosynthesis (AarF/ABC1/UbiB family)